MKKLKSLLVILLVIFLLVGVLFACGEKDEPGDDVDNTTGGKQVPVYQGMTITSVGTTLNGTPVLGPGNGNHDNDGKHNGWYKGDHDDKDHDFDKERPFPDNDDDENIETEIESSLKVEGTVEDIYYATPNQDIYINIHINNPDSFEIMSFTLNEKKYSSYMFEDGSDMETIILKYNVGDVSGVISYTIDAIKYVDGTEIKDVLIDGNKTVKAGVKTENQVQAIVSNLDVNTNSFSFSVNVKDNDGLIAYSKGSLKVVLYDGSKIVESKDLVVGSNVVSFAGLKTNALYQYAIIGSYDDFSGNGIDNNVLYKDALYTESVVLFSDIAVGQDGIAFGFIWHEDYVGSALTALKLYKGEQFQQEVEVKAGKVEGLLSGVTYTLVGTYDNKGKEEKISLEFNTYQKETPVVEIANATTTQTSVAFDITETDVDNVGTITKVELVHGNDSIVAESVDVREFTDLLSNNEYIIKVTYAYDLNDGVGAQEIVKTQVVTTLAKETPVVEIANATTTQTSIAFDITETDIDNVGTITKVELVHGNDSIVAESVDVREFTDLLSNNEYTIKVTYVYDLNDGVGAQEINYALVVYIEHEYLNFSKKEESYTVTGLKSNVSDLIIPASYRGFPVTSIGNAAFRDCDSLTSVTIPNSVTSIGDHAFDGCTSLSSVTIPNSVTSIGSYAFQNCTSLTSVTIGSSVTSIGLYAFYSCNSLSSVNYLGTIEQWCGITFGIMFYGCYSANPLWYGAKLYLNGELVEDLVIPNTVTKIKAYAFRGCDSITSVTIPDSVTSIGDDAFRYCDSLTSVTIGNSVTFIGDYAFCGCNSLSSVTIGNSVTSIGDYAFDYCNSLSTVYYNGTKEEWSGISIGDYNSYLTDATRYYYSETEPTGEDKYWHYVDGVVTVW